MIKSPPVPLRNCSVIHRASGSALKCFKALFRKGNRDVEERNVCIRVFFWFYAALTGLFDYFVCTHNNSKYVYTDSIKNAHVFIIF